MRGKETQGERFQTAIVLSMRRVDARPIAELPENCDGVVEREEMGVRGRKGPG